MDTLRSLLTSAAKFLEEAESCIARVKSLCKQPQKFEKDVQLLAAVVKKYSELKSESNHYKALVLTVLGKMSVAAGLMEHTSGIDRHYRIELHESGILLISYRGRPAVTALELVESGFHTEGLCTLIVDELNRSLIGMASERTRNAECVEKLSRLVTQLLEEKKLGMVPKRPSQ